MEFKFKINRTALIAVLAFFLATGFKMYDDLFEYSKNLEIFSTAYKEVGKNFVDDVEPGDLMRKGLDAMLASLDPYTVFYSESQTEEALLDRQGEYNGVGCRVFIRNNYPVVSEVFPDYAFAKADIRPGDVILKISGQSMQGKTIGDISVYLRGAPETEVAIEIQRDGLRISKNVKRVQVVNKNVPYFGMLKDGVGYVKLDQFGQKASNEIHDALVSLNKEGKLKQIVLDLRDNGGGLLNEAVNIVGLFTGPGQLVVKMKGRARESIRDWNTSGVGPFINTPLVVLVNAHSASASEVVSGSLQDMDRAVVIGRNSFGKGLVQNYFQLPYRTQMKVTTAKYYTPSGRCIQLLDYRHRTSDGSAGKMPDSLRTAFKTRNGRVVFDGAGVRPDVEIDEFRGQQLLKLMMDERLLFDYANGYRNSHDKIADVKSFRLTEKELLDFIESTRGKLTEIILDKLKISLNKSLPDSLMVKDIMAMESLHARIDKEVNSKLHAFKSSLQYRLTQEILKRYYSGASLYESSFDGDPDLEAALGVLQNDEKYRRLLRP